MFCLPFHWFISSSNESNCGLPHCHTSGMQFGELTLLLADLKKPGSIRPVVEHAADGCLAEHQFLTEHALVTVLYFILAVLLKFKRRQGPAKDCRPRPIMSISMPKTFLDNFRIDAWLQHERCSRMSNVVKANDRKAEPIHGWLQNH